MNRLLSAILIIFAVILINGDRVRSASAPLVSQELRQKAQSDGAVRVIVELALSAAAQSPLDSDIIGDLRRAEVAQARGLVRASLLGTRHSVVRQYQELPFIALNVGVDGLQTLVSLHGLVIRVVEDSLNRPFLSQSIPVVQADQVWAGGFGGTPFTGNGTVVAILDSGVDKEHPFLANKVVEEACFSSNDAGLGATSVCPGGVTSSFAPGSGMPCSAAINGCEHGTHVAGIAAGKGASFSGVAEDANIMAVQVFSRFDNPAFCGSADPCILAFNSDILLGLERVYAQRAVHNFASVNMSLGGGQNFTSCDNNVMKPAIDLLRSAGIATAIASGNDGFSDAIASPACISTSVSVGSTGDGSGGAALDVVSSFSNSASILSLLAPGSMINSSVTPGTGFANFQGTSMATPHVAGAFALLKEAGPNLTVSEMLSALQNTGLPVLDNRNAITKPRIRILNALFDLPLVDVIAPAKIADLNAGTSTQTSIALNWTAPGDDDDSGTAANYDVRVSTSKITDANWDLTTIQLNGEPTPSPAGSAQTFMAAGLFCDRNYFFATKTTDEVGNVSPLSNIVRMKTTACNKIIPSPSKLPVGEAGVAYSKTVDLLDGASPYDVQFDPTTLPPWLGANALVASSNPVAPIAIAGSSFTLTGTPPLTEAGKTFNLAAVITDAVGSVRKAKFKLKVAKPVEITTTALKPGKVNKPYSTTPRAKNGVKAYSWTAQLNSALPVGSTFAFDPVKGKISVLATDAGSVDVTFRVTDAAGGTDTQIVTLTFN
jgi:subtilisin family serine protease